MAELGRVGIAGVSARGLAVSAAAAGYRVVAVDAFGDLDLRAAAERVIALRRDQGFRYTPAAAVRALSELGADSVAYLANFENHPAAVDRIAARWRLLGNSGAVLRRVRNPILLMRTLRRLGFATPRTRASPPPRRSGTTPRWLLKPRRSGGGHATRPWHPGIPVGRAEYLQERIAGIAGSIVFAADGRRAVPLGLSRQLIGDRAFGAHGFRYCGSMLSGPGARLFPQEERLRSTATAIASAVVQEFRLVGLNGIDFIARNGVPYPIEVNPRWSSSMELVERACGVSIFELHARASLGRLPLSLPSHEPLHPLEGKAIVFARRAGRVGETRRWLKDGAHADVPHPRELIGRGHPICTVYARAHSEAGLLRELQRRAMAVYAAVEPVRRGAA